MDKESPSTKNADVKNVLSSQAYRVTLLSSLKSWIFLPDQGWLLSCSVWVDVGEKWHSLMTIPICTTNPQNALLKHILIFYLL